MARPLRIQYPHAYYHVTCRGNDRRSIYRDDRDRELFLERLRTSLERYKWSSLPGYLDPSKRQRWGSYEEVGRERRNGKKVSGEFIEDGLREGYETPWEKVTGQVALAREEFVADLGKRVGSRTSRREQPSVKTFQRVQPEKVLSIVSRKLKVKREDLVRRRTGYRNERAIAIDLLYRYSAINQREIGKRLGALDYSAVRRERTRLRERIKVDRRLGKSLREIEEVLDQR